ncbi:MAG: hypothetical protein U9R17_07430 [Thermodesulfobacteriota bacterium]|nr:hypothetical protein [Thermodesulfobacteriota bacterium]
MLTKVRSRKEVLSLIDKLFGRADQLQVGNRNEEIIIRKAENVVEKTRGTIKNLDFNIIKKIAGSEEFSGY